ncbi:protein kinase, partial [Klebsiella pneumoniae]|uniref:protein kinase n=1 Tax=Klebsiella pneumoniae TaxID=573 RepID=UPI003EE1E97A
VGGRYALGELLGVGGTGSVFAATDRDADDAPVAVKLLHPHLCADADARAAFLREAARASELRDPHIVRVHG